MAAAAHEVRHYHLPARIRARKARDDSFSCRLALADRMADLAGIQTVEDGDGILPNRVTVYLQAPSSSQRREHAALLLCKIGRDEIEIHGLDVGDRHRVLRAGWGRLRQDHVLMYPPRDHAELEVCWNIIQRAYRFLADASARSPLARKLASVELPKFSRTALQ
jgi:hypothetical protein